MIKLSIEHCGEGLGAMLNNHVSVWRCQIPVRVFVSPVVQSTE